MEKLNDLPHCNATLTHQTLHSQLMSYVELSDLQFSIGHVQYSPPSCYLDQCWIFLIETFMSLTKMVLVGISTIILGSLSHTYASEKAFIVGSDNGFVLVWCHSINWTNAVTLWMKPVWQTHWNSNQNTFFILTVTLKMPSKSTIYSDIRVLKWSQFS